MARILVAEDDPQVREVIVRICEFRGHDVEQAPDGVRALEEYDRVRPDLLITDLAMPRGSGEQLVRKIRERGRPCPVIVITGYAAAPFAGRDDSVPAVKKEVAVKCDLCRDVRGGPACVRSCPTGAAIRLSPQTPEDLRRQVEQIVEFEVLS